MNPEKEEKNLPAVRVLGNGKLASTHTSRQVPPPPPDARPWQSAFGSVPGMPPHASVKSDEFLLTLLAWKGTN